MTAATESVIVNRLRSTIAWLTVYIRASFQHTDGQSQQCMYQILELRRWLPDEPENLRPRVRSAALQPFRKLSDTSFIYCFLKIKRSSHGEMAQW